MDQIIKKGKGAHHIMGIIGLIVWAMFAYHGLSVLGFFFLGRFMFKSNLIWLGALLEPAKTSKSITSAVVQVGKHALWTIVSLIALSMLYT